MTEDEGPMIFQHLMSCCFPNPPKVIFEIGAMDGADSIRLSKLFPEAKIYAFEPNPDTVDIALEATVSNPKIRVIPMAVSEVSRFIPFYKSDTANHGCSSLYRASGRYDHVEPMPQSEVTVSSTRLDQFIPRLNIGHVDALWLDAQGSELSILKSLGTRIETVWAVWTEVFYDELYVGQPLFPELLSWMTGAGFKLQWSRDVLKDDTGKCWWGDAFFVNERM